MADTNSTADNKKSSFWDSTLGTITKVTALIAAVTSLIVAINQFRSAKTSNANYPPSDKHIDPSKDTDPSPVKPTVAPVIRIGGSWRDVNNSANGSNITQEGSSFQFEGWGNLQGIPFRSTGSGTITGETITSSYTTTYQSGSVSQGRCQGNVSSDGLQMTLTCTDNVLGTFVSSAARQ